MVYKLDTIDKRILFELDKNARIPETQLAKIVHRSKESVRYRIKKLQEEKVLLGFTTWIDLAKIGYTSAKIYLTLSNKPELKQEFVDYIRKDKRLFWLGIAEGAWNAGLTFFVRSNREFFDLKNDIFTKFKELILDSRTAVLVSVSVHDKTFLCPADTHWKTLFHDIGNFSLEEIEKKILKELFKNARINIVDIARKHNSTVDIVRNRIKKLEKEQIIFAYKAVIDYNRLGYEFFKTFLYFKNLNKADEKRLVEYTQNNSNMVHLVKQISPWDIELEIMCLNYQEYNQIISDLTKEFSTVISKVETAIMGEDYVFPAEKMIFE